MHSPLEGTPEIDYPTDWIYQVIGEDEAAMRAAIALIAGIAEHRIETGNVSGQGRYRSLRVTVAVTDESHRVGIFRELGGHDSIRVVL